MTVTAPPDTTAPTVAAPSVTQSVTPMKRGALTTLTTTATDNVAVKSVTFTYSYTVNGVKQTGTAVAKQRAPLREHMEGTFTPSTSVPSGTSYTFNAVATDTATPTANQTTSAATPKTFQ